MESEEDFRKGIHPPKFLPDVPPPRALVDEMYRERRPVPPPPRDVTSENLIAPRVKLAGPFGGFLDAEAHQNSNPKEAFVRHGSLLVPRDHEAEFEKAERYLSKDPEAMGVLYKLEHDTHDHQMRIGDDVRSQESDGNIAWNPHLATRDEHGHSISPALSLLHEEDHAIENADTKKRLRDAVLNDSRWDTLEEERVITGVENRAARILHEGVRDSHEGWDDGEALNVRGDYWVDSVTSRAASSNQQRSIPSDIPNYAPGSGVSRTKSQSGGRGR